MCITVTRARVKDLVCPGHENKEKKALVSNSMWKGDG